MFQARDYSVFLPSPNAERAFKRLRTLDIVITALFAIIMLLCIWNIGRLAQLRMIDNQDLADVRSITDDFSTKLIWILTPLTAIIIALRELLVGDRGFALIFPLTGLLALFLVPAAMSEIQPPLQDQTLRVVMHECPPKAIVNDELSAIGRCEPFAMEDGEVMLAVSDPTEDSFDTVEPESVAQNTVTYTLSGRGTYTVYFMFRYDDTHACEQSSILPRGGSFSSANHQCIDHNNAVWKVLPHTTAANRPSGINLIEVTLP